MVISRKIPSNATKGRCKKNVFLGLCPKLWVGGGPKPQNFLVKITIQLFYLFLGLCPKIGVAVGGWGPVLKVDAHGAHVRRTKESWEDQKAG